METIGQKLNKEIIMDEHKTIFETRQSYPNQASFNLRAETNAVTLDDILPVFEDFLRGSGFVFDGHLDIVKHEK